MLMPNLSSLAVRLIGAKYRYIFPEHLNYFTPQTMKKFAELEFQVVGMKSTHFNPIVIWQDFRGGERAISRAERVKLLKRTTGYKQSKALFLIKAAYRASEFALGKLSLADNIAVVGRKVSP